VTSRTTPRLAVVATVALLLSGCGFQRDRVDEITPEHIVGSWSATVDGHVIDLDVDADGWLKFSNIPPQALGADGPLDWDKPLESSGGSWQLVKDPFGEGDPWFWITMTRAPGDRITTQLFVHGLEPDIELWRYWNGESDPPIRFERVGDDD
jgi:hypothetical protein